MGVLLGIGAALAIRRVWRRFGTQQLPAQDADPPPTVPGEPPPTGRGEDSPETKGDDLASLTSAELYRRAQAAAIRGRAAMTKAQLIDALRASSD
jgi:hypothetical protein